MLTRTKVLLGLVGVVILLLIFSGEDKSIIEFSVNAQCLVCEERNTSVKIFFSPPEDVEYNIVTIEAYYGSRYVESYQCYPLPEEVREAYFQNKDSKEYWEEMSVRGDFSCYYNTTELKKAGEYVLSVTLINTLDDGGIVGRGNTTVEIMESNITPPLLKDKKIYQIKELIPHNPIPNLVIYGYETTAKIPVLQCPLKNGMVAEAYCNEKCSTQDTIQSLQQCREQCVKEEMEACSKAELEADEDKYFVLVHYGVGMKEEDASHAGIECDSNIAGLCVIPLTLSLSSQMASKITEIMSNEAFSFLAGMMMGFGFISTQYGFALMDEWDVTYTTFTLPKDNETYYVFDFPTPYPPLVFQLPKGEKPSYLVGKRTTQGLFLFIIPLKKEDVLYGVDLRDALIKRG